MKEMIRSRKAVIMAGGEGSRLRPLTCNIPKPMTRICGRPVLEHILELLKKHEFSEAAVTLMYLPQEIKENFPSEEYKGIFLNFIEEDTPLGTAGSVKNAAKNYDEPFLVISGDAVCDFDIGEIFRAHEKSGCAATIVAKRVKDPGEYGLLKTESGRVCGFIEKPAYSQAVSDLANTGVYILAPECMELVPDGEKYDFAKELFPKMLEKGMQIAVYEEKGYWCDIGDIGSYIRCQRDILFGRAPMYEEEKRDRFGSVIKSEGLEKAVIEPPVYIGRGVKIAEGAVIESGSVLDDGCVVGKGVHIKNSIILENSVVEDMASISGAIVCSYAKCGKKSMMFEGAVLGSHSELGKNSRINPGIKVWQGKKVGANEVVDGHVKVSSGAGSRFDEDGISALEKGAASAQFYAKVGAAAVTSFKKEYITVGCYPSKACRAAKQALISGIQSAGCDSIDFGEDIFGAFAFGMSFGGFDAGIYIFSGEGGAPKVRVYERGGIPASRGVERGIEKAISAGEFSVCEEDGYGEGYTMNGNSAIYRATLKKLGKNIFRGKKVAIHSDNAEIKKVIEGVLGRKGEEKFADVEIVCNANGECSISEGDAVLSGELLLEVCCISEFEKGKNVALWYGAPRVFDEIAKEYGARVERYLECPADESDASARKLAEGQLWSRDPLMRVVTAAAYMEEKKLGVKSMLERVIPIAVKSDTVAVSGNINPGKIVGELEGEEITAKSIGEGKILKVKDGYVVVRPLKRGEGIKITAEASKYETASEICGDFVKMIKAKNGETIDR